MTYLRGLMSTVERKHGWQLAEAAGEQTPDGMQRLLNTAHWDADQVRDDLRTYILTHLADPQAVLVVDETGFLKKGDKSAGVAPQYSGTVGKMANCQIGMFLAYATRAGPVLLDRELYLPAEWASDQERCQEAEIPEGVTCIPKPTLAKRLLERAFAAGVPAAWVTADSVYGGDDKLRSWLEERLQPYVLAIPKNQRIGITTRADAAVSRWAPEAWQRLSAGEGSQGPRWYDGAWKPLTFRCGAVVTRLAPNAVISGVVPHASPNCGCSTGGLDVVVPSIFANTISRPRLTREFIRRLFPRAIIGKNPQREFCRIA